MTDTEKVFKPGDIVKVEVIARVTTGGFYVDPDRASMYTFDTHGIQVISIEKTEKPVPDGLYVIEFHSDKEVAILERSKGRWFSTKAQGEVDPYETFKVIAKAEMMSEDNK